MARGSSARNSAKNFYSRNRQEDEEEKKAKAEEQQSAAPKADAPDPAPAAEQEAKPRVSVVNDPAFQKAQEQGFRRTQQEYAKTVGTEVVRTGEMYLPERMEKHREILEKNNAAGMMGNGTTFGYAVNDIAVDINTIKDEKQLAYFASTLDSDWDKVTVYKAWAKQNGKHYDDVLYNAEQMLGNRLFSKPQSSMGILSGLADVNGNQININTARPEMVTQGIQGIADPEERAVAVKAFKNLCSNRGSRFFGYFPPEDIDTFRDSYSLTQTEYNSLCKEYKQLFKQGADAQEFNAEQYHMQLASIQENENYDALAKRNLIGALEKAYYSVTYADKLPDKPAEKMGPEEQKLQPEDKDGKDQRWFHNIGEKIEDGIDAAKEFLFGPDDEQGKEPEAEAAVVHPEVPQEETEQTVAEESQDTGAPSSPSGASSVALFADAVLGNREMPGAHLLKEQAPEYIHAADDGEVLDLMYQGKGYLIAPEDRARIDELMKDQNVRKLHGALDAQAMNALEVGNEPAEMITSRSMSSFGTTIYGAYQDIMSDEFPRELRGDGMMILTEVVHAAGQAYAKGQLVCPDNANSFEMYLDANPEERKKIQSIYDNWNQLIENENKIRAEEEQKSAKALEDARAAVLSGQYSDAQLALVQENATAEWEDVLDDEMRAVMNAQLNRQYFMNGSFERTSVYKNLSARGVKDTGSFIASIKSEMHALLDEDTETALSLGLSLEQYYERIGGMNLDQLAQRANVRMQQQGASITPEEKEELIGTGEGVGVIPATGYGIARGAQNWWGTFNDSLYKGMTQANVVRTAEKMTGYYQSEFGPYGRDYYREDLTALIGSGELSEEYAKALQQAMDSAADIYDIGLDPNALGGLRSTAAQMRENVAQIDTFMSKNGTPGENRWYGFASAITENTISATVAGTGSALTGNAAAGFFLGYDVTSYGQNYDARLAQGYSLNSASHMAAWDTAASHLANSGTFEKIYGQISGATTLGRAGWFEAMGKNPSGAMKAKAAIGMFTKTFVGNVFDEAVSDELKENVTAQAADKMFGPIYRKIDAGENIEATDVLGAMLNVTDVDLVKAGRDVATGFFDAAITSSLFALAGASVTTITSVRMAKDIVAGKSKDIAGFVEAAKADMSNPETAEAINDDARAQQQDEAVVHVLIRDDGSDGKIAKHQKLQEQADSHKQELDASTVRIEEGWKSYDEQKAAGNMQAAVDALEDIDKAEQGQKEHAREEAQKTYEANQVREEKLHDARKTATIKLAQEAEAKRTQLQGDNENRKRSLDAEIEEVESQLAAVQEQIAQIDTDDFDMAAFDDLAQKRSDLEDRRLALLGEAQESEAVQEARNAAESALNAQDEEAAAAMQQAAEKEAVAQEKVTMAPIYKDLRTRAIYVDAQQAAEIKSMTGLTIPQFNRKYGMSLTQDKAKGRNSLDGSFFADLAAQAPGYIDGETTHPEEAIVALAERKKELAGVQASIGSADAEAYITETTEGTLDPVTQKMASDLYKKTGIKLVTANLADGTRGWFDRANGQLVLSNKLGAGELRRVVVLHELTHFVEKSKGYEEYKNAVLEAAYAGDEAATERDREDIREEYGKHGVTLSESELDAELVAAATETVIGGDEAFFEQLIESGKRSFVKRVYMKLRTFLNRQKAKKASPEALAQYDAIQKAHDLMEQALRKAPKLTDSETGSDPTTAMSELTQDTDNRPAEQTQMQYAIVQDGYGRKRVKADRQVILSKDPAKWNNEIQQYIQSTIRKNGNVTIYADDGDVLVFDATTQWHAGSRNPNTTDAEYKTKLNASAHLDELGQIARDQQPNRPNKPDRNGKHGALASQGWRYKRAIFEDYDGQLYRVRISVAHSPNGKVLYNIGDVDPVGNKKTGTTVAGSSGNASVSVVRSGSGNTIVQQNAAGVKNQSMQSSVQKSIGIRQFGNNTMQRADFIEDHVKELVKDSEYERDTNRDQVKRATETLDRNGLEATTAMLMNKEKSSYTADDNALAFVAMADATRNGDSVTAAMLAMRMLEESTEKGRALQSLKIALRLTPEGAMGEAMRKAQTFNAKRKNVDSKFIPTGNEAPKGQPKANGEKTTVAPYIQKIYDAAADLKGRLDKLGGETSRDNPWGLPMNEAQMELAKKYGLMGTALPSDYAHATLKQRMLSAIIATPDGVRGDGLLTLCQQLEFMKEGYAVVTEADLNYIAGQMSEVIAQGGVENDIPKTREGQIALSRVYDAQANITPASFGVKFDFLRYANMLSAPATWTRNVASNILVTPLEDASTVVATFADWLTNKAIHKGRTTTIANSAERKDGKSAFSREIANTVTDYFIDHVDTGHGRKFDVGTKGRRVFQSEFLETYRNIVDFAMQIGDRPFYEKCYAKELAIIKRLGMKVNEGGKLRDMTADEMHKEATARATERVFQEDGGIVKWINSAPAGVQTVMRTIVPFPKTTTNIAMRMFQYSPAGLAKAIVWDGLVKAKIKNGADFDQRKFVMGVGRGVTGLGMIAFGAALYAAGWLKTGRGDEEDKKRRDILGDLGEPYSMYIELFGQKHEIDWALPSATGLILGASMMERIEDGEMGMALIGGMMADLGDELFENSFLSSINDLFRGYEDAAGVFTRGLTTTTESLASQTLSPSFIRAIAKATDPYVRDTTDDNPIWAAFKQNVVQYWPGLRQMLPIKTDITGDKQLQSGYWNPEGEHGSMVMQMLDSFLTPTATIGEKNDAALIELLDLAYRTGEGGFLPADLISANGSSLYLTKDYAKDLKYGEAGITMELTDDEKRIVNAQHGDLLFNGDGGRRYRDNKNDYIDFPGLRLIMEDRAMYVNKNKKYEQEKPWSKMDDEERAALVDRMSDDAKLLITLDVARKKKEAGEL